MTPDQKQKILYLCTGNSCRSQMADGLTNALRGDDFLAFSAGVRPSTIDPRAVQAMAQLGIDIGGQASKDLSELPEVEFDWVVTLCSNAAENCPFFPGPVKRVHRGFDDPPLLAANAQSDEEALSHYERVRDEIKAMVLNLPRSLQD